MSSSLVILASSLFALVSSAADPGRSIADQYAAAGAECVTVVSADPARDMAFLGLPHLDVALSRDAETRRALGAAAAACPFFVVYAPSSSALAVAFGNASEWRGVLRKRDAMYALVLEASGGEDDGLIEGGFFGKALNVAVFRQDVIKGR